MINRTVKVEDRRCIDIFQMWTYTRMLRTSWTNAIASELSNGIREFCNSLFHGVLRYEDNTEKKSLSRKTVSGKMPNMVDRLRRKGKKENAGLNKRWSRRSGEMETDSSSTLLDWSLTFNNERGSDDAVMINLYNILLHIESCLLIIGNDY